MTHFAQLPLLTAAVLMLVHPAAQAQGGERALAASLRECRQIAEASARTACYDGIPLDEPERRAAVGQPDPAPAERRGGAEFGRDQLPPPASRASSEPDRISAQVTRVAVRQPGIYLLTLDDDTEWQFIDGAPASYDPPRPGSTVEISRASLGSYLLRYAGQRAVRARRVR